MGGYTALKGRRVYLYTISVGKPERKKLLGKPGRIILKGY
jgi:predicted RNA-binding protein YlqC (UPF0109 family)